MLQQHIGSLWIAPKVNEKVRDMTQRQQHQDKRKNFFIRLSMDKRFRWYAMVATPFLVFYLAGLILSASTLFIIKVVLLAILYGISYTLGRILFDDHLLTLLPLSVYMATK